MAITKVTTPVTGFKSNVDIGLKIPVGTNSNVPTGAEGMIRNDTEEVSGGTDSTTAITFYNGTTWKYFASTPSQDSPPIENFNTVLYTGNGSAQTLNVSTIGFQPDLVWLKQRTGSLANHLLADTVRGPWKIIMPNNIYFSDRTSIDKTITSFADGFTVKDTTQGTYECNGPNGGTYSGNGTYVAWCFKAGGLINKAADFNGSSSIIKSTALGTAFISQTTLSISAWFKTSQSTRLTIASFSDTNNGSTDLWLGSDSSGDTISFRNVNNGINNLQFDNAGGSSIRDGAWHHVVFTADSSGTRIYVDGSELTGFTYQNGLQSTTIEMPTSLNQFSIGANQDSSATGGQWFLNGQINQVRVFTSALSASQVTELYNETKADNSVLNYPAGANCITAYPLGENADSLNSAYNGTEYNVTFGLPGYLTRNNEGTIESTVSVNDTLGFSIVSYTGPALIANTVGHGLGQTPEMIILKSTSINRNWNVFHKDVGTSKNMHLNEASIADTSEYWTASTDTFSIQDYSASADWIAYCFVSKPGFSKVGSYIGNGNSTGPVVPLSFPPAWVMIKGVNEASDWMIFDNKRSPTNPANKRIDANTSGNESTDAVMDLNSDGFQIKTASAGKNALNKQFIYLAFAK